MNSFKLFVSVGTYILKEISMMNKSNKWVKDEIIQGSCSNLEFLNFVLGFPDLESLSGVLKKNFWLLSVSNHNCSLDLMH